MQQQQESRTPSKNYPDWYKVGKRTLEHESGNAKVTLSRRHSNQNPLFLVWVNNSWVCERGTRMITEFRSLDSAISKAEELLKSGMTLRS